MLAGHITSAHMQLEIIGHMAPPGARKKGGWEVSTLTGSHSPDPGRKSMNGSGQLGVATMGGAGSQATLHYNVHALPLKAFCVPQCSSGTLGHWVLPENAI